MEHHCGKNCKKCKKHEKVRTSKVIFDQQKGNCHSNALWLEKGDGLQFTNSDGETSQVLTGNYFEHPITLQLTDSGGVFIAGTESTITLDVFKENNRITIELPEINFQTLGNGGFVYTASGFLPEDVRPRSIVNRTIVAGSNNGATEPYDNSPTTPFPANPPAGYLVQITSAGALVIQSAGTPGNVIATGPQILLECEISYLLKPAKKTIIPNYPVSTGPTTTALFTGGARTIGLRDAHVCDVYDNVIAYAWSDNSNIDDKTNGTTNVWVRTGSIANGHLLLNPIVQLTNLPVQNGIFYTSIAINRKNTQNIVVSYKTIEFRNPDRFARNNPFVAVSKDGGKTFYINQRLVVDNKPAPPAGDNLGVYADKFGNIWYGSISNFAKPNLPPNDGAPYFAISADQGVTFTTAYMAPAVKRVGEFYDSPYFNFGTDDKGQYGLWFAVDYYDINNNIIPVTGFVPILTLGSTGPGSSAFLNSLLNTQAVPSITGSDDGRVWIISGPSPIGSFVAPTGVRFKSPGLLNENYSGTWNVAIINQTLLHQTNQISQPVVGFFNSSQTIIYDNKRQALYAIVAGQSPDLSQNMKIYFVISRNNGMTWSKPINIATSEYGNRGFQSMALDTVTENLVFTWYDGRIGAKDNTYIYVEFYTAILLKDQLDELVNKIPLSNPLLATGDASQPLYPPSTSKIEKTIMPRIVLEK